jgi:hypothetical protein
MSYINATINTARGNKVKFVSMEGTPKQYWVYKNGDLTLTHASICIEHEGSIMIVATNLDGSRVEKWIDFDPAAQSA